MGAVAVFRADASRHVGYGHVMRCLALADALRRRGVRCLFVFGPGGDVLAGEVTTRGHLAATLPSAGDEVADAAATLAAGVAVAPNRLLAVVLDHYGLGPAWESGIRQGSKLLMVIDDLPRTHACDILLDQNVIGSRNPYQGLVPAQCQCLLGPSYALLRPEFARLRESAAVRRKLARILIFFGGSDPTDETGKVLRGILWADGAWGVDVVIGSANPHRAALETLVAQNPNVLRLHVQTPHMAELMLAADLAIGAGGSASWERCSLKLPSIVSVLADNQALIAERLEDAGAVVNLGRADGLTSGDYGAAVLAMDDTELSALSMNAAALCDGLGADRVAERMELLCGSVQ